MILTCLSLMISESFSGGASGREPASQCRRHKRHRFDLWVGKILWRRAWKPTPVFLPGECHGQRACQATVHRVIKNWTQLSDLAHTRALCLSHLVIPLVGLFIPKRTANIRSHKNLYTNGHSRIIYNNQQVETTQCPKLTNGQTKCVYILTTCIVLCYKGILYY